MNGENTVADRLLQDARRKTARQESTNIGRIALGLGIVALLASPVSIAGWVLGTATIITGGIGVRRPGAANLSKIAIALGVLAVLVGVFFFTLNIARG